MLQDMRKYTKVVLYIVVVAFIGTIIFAWGADITQSGGQGTTVGKVNDEEIDIRTYDQVLTSYSQQVAQSSERELSHDEVVEIRNRAWVELVNDIVFRQTTEELGLVVTNAELAEHIRRFPPQIVQQQPVFLDSNGQFNYQFYLQAMTDPQFNQFWLQVEGMMRPEIRDIKLQELVLSTGRVTGEDIKQEFIANNERLKLEYAIVYKDQQKDDPVSTDSAAVEAYYNENKDRYFRDETAELSYVGFAIEPTDTDKQGTRDQIQSIYDEVKDGADFADLARSLSEDGSAANGGDLGWFGEGAMLAPFEEAAFTLADSGDISEPVETQFGWHVILKTGQRETADGNPEVRASHILLKYKPSGQTISDRFSQAQAFVEYARDNGFEEAVEFYNLEASTSGSFQKGTYAGSLGQSPLAAIFAFDSKVGEVSGILEESGRYLVVKLNSFQPSGIRPLSEVFGRAQSDLSQKAWYDRAFNKAQRLRQLVAGGQDMESACTEIGAEYLVTDGFVSRRDPIIKLGRDPSFLGVAFTLKPDNPLSDAIKVGKGAAVVRLLDREAPNLEAYTAVQDSIMNDMLGQTRQRVFQNWYQNLQEANEVKDFRSEFYSNN